MMREIKFRAWIQDGEWEEDGSQQKYVMCYDMAFEDYEPINDILAGVENLMQYTGLKDKNAREIYEGDILIGAGSREGGPSEVFFSYGQWQPFSFLGTYCGAEFEVIGNVHENPELLSKRQEAKG
jgi:hypothetical protein